MNRTLAEKLLATVFVLALFGGIYFLIQTFTQDLVNKRVGEAKKTLSVETDQPMAQRVIPAVSLPIGAVDPYYYLEDFYVETRSGLVLRTHSDVSFEQVLTPYPVERPVISGAMLQFTEIKNGQRQQQYFNLEALVNQLNNAQ